MNKDLHRKAVILITIDALRADHLKCYGYHRNTTPNLNKFAEEGKIFLNTITNGPETPTAFSSLFTSILPFLDGGYSPLPSQKISLVQLLRENRIFTYSIHSNPNLGRIFNYDRGFDVFLDGERYKRKSNDSIKQLLSYHVKKILDSNRLSSKLIYRLKGFNKIKLWLRKKIPFLTEILLPFTPIAYNAPYIVSKVISFLNNSKKPFFLWAHFMDVHSPYNPPAKNVINFREKDFSISEREFLTNKVYSMSLEVKTTSRMIEDLKILYDAEIHFVDEYLKKLIELIKNRFKDNCLVIITADHGESFYEHGLFGHQGSVYDEILKIPLIIVELGKKPIEKDIKDVVQIMDIAPTILDYFGIDIPENFQGSSLIPIIKGENPIRKEVIISECYQKNRLMKRNRKEGLILFAIRKHEWKYIFDEEKEAEFLFNLKSDPKEKNNLIGENPEKLEEFRIIKEYHLEKTTTTSHEQSKIIKAIGMSNLNKTK